MKLQDIADIDPQTETSRLAPTDLVSFIPMSDVSDDGRWLGSQRRTLLTVRSGYTAFRDGDILFAKITPCMENGKGCLAVGLANGIGFGSTEFHVLRPKPGVPASYLFQWTKFEELRRRAVNAMTGSAGQQRVPAEFLRSYSIPDHSVNEQRAIARVLDAADHRIQQLEALLAKSIRVNLGITTELLTRGVDAQGRLRDPAKDGFTSSPIGALPDEWALSTLKLVCQKIGVGIATSCSAYFIDKGVPLIRNQNITKDGVSDHDLIHITTAFAEANRTKALRAGDIITVRTGYPGLSCVVTEGQEGWQTFTTLISRPDRRIVNPEFLAAFINSSVGCRQIQSLQAGGAQQNLNSRVLETLLVPVPRLEEQGRIVHVLGDLEAAAGQIRFQFQKLIHIKNGLMQELLRGRVSVSALITDSSGLSLIGEATSAP